MPGPTVTTQVRAVAPGRVNLIGDHTDHCGGPVLPMAIDLATTVTGVRGTDSIDLTSHDGDGRVELKLPVTHPDRVEPAWGRHVAGVASLVGPSTGLTGTVTTTLPLGVGLSSSTALEVAVALALGATGSRREIAELCQRAEQQATGVPCGIMDQLASLSGIEGHALLIDCATLHIQPIPVPDDVVVWVVPSGESRSLAGSRYAERRAECGRAEAVVGALPEATFDAIGAIDDPVARARARHVRSESDRVRAAGEALSRGDVVTMGRLMAESHRSLRDDFEVSTPGIDRLVADLAATAGVFGARMTGGGFGGSIVAIAAPGIELPGRIVRPSAGATVTLT